MKGASLYGDSDLQESPLYSKFYHRLLFLREFVQNGMDAMKLQLFRNIQEDRYGMFEELKKTAVDEWNIFEILDNFIGFFLIQPCDRSRETYSSYNFS